MKVPRFSCNKYLDVFVFFGVYLDVFRLILWKIRA